jgi:5-methylcytosine-specific restriction endonuclease McrA
MDRRRFNRRERAALRIVAGNRCEACGCDLTDAFHADHKKPFARGGKTEITNGQALCPPCNLRKSDHETT